MLAVQFDRFGPPGVLTVGPFPEPHAGSSEVRIRVRAAGVSPVDLNLRAGLSPSRERIRLPHVPGVDAAGVIDEVGQGVTGFSVGDAVFGAVDVARLGGASAELAVLGFWAAKPSSMSWEEAGAAATSIETATRVLDKLGVNSGTTLLIDAAAQGTNVRARPRGSEDEHAGGRFRGGRPGSPSLNDQCSAQADAGAARHARRQHSQPVGRQ